jgi:hypothetical protein
VLRFSIGFAVMRYSPYSKAITAFIDSGELGQLVNATQLEPIGYFHFAHSYVRGNWHSEEKSSFVLMSKSCQLASLINDKWHCMIVSLAILIFSADGCSLRHPYSFLPLDL